MDGFERLLQHQAIHGHDGQGCVVRLEQEAMPRGHFVNEALHVEGYWFRRHGSLHLNPIKLLEQLALDDLKTLLRDERKLAEPDGLLESQPPGQHQAHVVTVSVGIALSNNDCAEKFVSLLFGHAELLEWLTVF